jgi:hypothetical protein
MVGQGPSQTPSAPLLAPSQGTKNHHQLSTSSKWSEQNPEWQRALQARVLVEVPVGPNCLQAPEGTTIFNQESPSFHLLTGTQTKGALEGR